MNNIALYIHWPFCESKCPYCDFNSHVRDKVDSKTFLNAYITSLDHHRETLENKSVTSIFFGGGTPSLMNPEEVAKIINHVDKNYNLSPSAEITLEANPSSSEAGKFKELKASGINRLSLGIQSFDNERLKFLGRRHNAEEAQNAIKMASEIFDNFSFDLIYNLPNQTDEELEQSLKIAFDYSSPHLSLYQLTIEKGTKFFNEFRAGSFSLPDEELSLKLYEKVKDECYKRGLNRYEVSNYAKDGFECKHNLSYWNYDEYLGIGAGAHSRINVAGNRMACFDTHNPEKWLEQVLTKGNGIQSNKKMSIHEIADELIFMGLRTQHGLSKDKFRTLIGYQLEDFYNKEFVNNLKNNMLIDANNKSIRLTDQGLLLHSNIVYKLSNNTCITK